jgi:hypothetical protein
VLKLKDHILPRIQEMLRREALAADDSSPPQAGLSAVQRPNADRDSLFFKGDRMYRHHLARFNYTTYDVRRSQDVINPGTSHCDIMLLADNAGSDTDSVHPFLYARVLGIYHVNVIYTGMGSLDYIARRVEFLWVRWFEYDADRSVKWEDLKLDPIRFPPMSEKGAFGFVDPKDVLRGCHIVPSFAKWEDLKLDRIRFPPTADKGAFGSKGVPRGGHITRDKARVDGIGLSRLAHDAQDWSRYRVNRCVHTIRCQPLC